MKFRWCIRGFAIALLTFCLSVWGWSYFYYVHIAYKSYEVETYTGGVKFRVDNIEGSASWWFDHGHRPLLSLSNLMNNANWRFLGFAYQNWSSPPRMIRDIAIPFWFPSLLSGGLLWFMWRQTRVEMAGRGFPVEVVQAK